MLIGRVGKVCILSGALVLGAAGARAQTVDLKLSHFVPPQHAFHKWAVEWAKRLEDASNGRLKITIYPNGQLVGPPNRQFDAARNGITDIAFTLHGVTPGRYPMTELANLPFTWPSEGALCSVMGKRMTELAPKYLAQEHVGLHILFMTMANPIVIYSKVPIKTVDDFKGLKNSVRIDHQQEHARRPRRDDDAHSAAGVPGRSGQGHRPGRDLPA